MRDRSAKRCSQGGDGGYVRGPLCRDRASNNPPKLCPMRSTFRPDLFSAFSIVSFNWRLIRRLGHSVLKPIPEKKGLYPMRANY